jgi:hypothetical protein
MLRMLSPQRRAHVAVRASLTIVYNVNVCEQWVSFRITAAAPIRPQLLTSSPFPSTCIRVLSARDLLL